jgi:hypothetical protein
VQHQHADQLEGQYCSNHDEKKDEKLKDGVTNKIFLKGGKGVKRKPKPKENRRVRGRLSKDEEVEIRRTCNNVIDWLKPTSMIIQTSQDNTDITYKHDVQ